MKKLENLKGAKALSRNQQRSVNGGIRKNTCGGKPAGTPCYVNGDYYEPGECDGNGNCVAC